MIEFVGTDLHGDVVRRLSQIVPPVMPPIVVTRNGYRVHVPIDTPGQAAARSIVEACRRSFYDSMVRGWSFVEIITETSRRGGKTAMQTEMLNQEIERVASLVVPTPREGLSESDLIVRRAFARSIGGWQ